MSHLFRDGLYVYSSFFEQRYKDEEAAHPQAARMFQALMDAATNEFPQGAVPTDFQVDPNHPYNGIFSVALHRKAGPSETGLVGNETLGVLFVDAVAGDYSSRGFLYHGSPPNGPASLHGGGGPAPSSPAVPQELVVPLKSEFDEDVIAGMDDPRVQGLHSLFVLGLNRECPNPAAELGTGWKESRTGYPMHQFFLGNDENGQELMFDPKSGMTDLDSWSRKMHTKSEIRLYKDGSCKKTTYQL